MTRWGLGPLKEETGVGTVDVANRMADYGVDPWWMSHEPWVVPEPFTPEAGEMYGKEDLDYWIAVVERIVRGGAPRPRAGQDRPTPPADRPDRRRWSRRSEPLGDDLARLPTQARRTRCRERGRPSSRRQVRVIEAPPSTSEAVPVTKAASSEAR